MERAEGCNPSKDFSEAEEAKTGYFIFTIMEISIERARKFADENCSECNGEGWTYDVVAPDDRREVYCICAQTNMAEYEAEMREEE